jgi:predicted aspartyl protease
VRPAILLIFIVLASGASSRAIVESVPFKLHRNYLIVAECSVANQKVLTAIIDTGTTETILDTRVVKRLSLATWADSVTALTTDAAVRGVYIPDLRLGPLRTGKLEGIAIDLSAMSRELGVRADLVIGMDVLHRFNFVIDYEARVMRFGLAPAMAYGTALAPGTRLALIGSNVLGRRVRLQVDTGFNGLLLFGKRLERLGRSLETRALDTNGAGTGARLAGVAQGSSVRNVSSRQVQIGNWNGSHVPVSVMDSAPRDFEGFDEGFDGLFGPRALGSRRVAFDFDNRMLYWE